MGVRPLNSENSPRTPQSSLREPGTPPLSVVCLSTCSACADGKCPIPCFLEHLDGGNHSSPRLPQLLCGLERWPLIPQAMAHLSPARKQTRERLKAIRVAVKVTPDRNVIDTFPSLAMSASGERSNAMGKHHAIVAATSTWIASMRPTAVATLSRIPPTSSKCRIRSQYCKTR